jgi:hypothetical protein
MDSDGNRSPVDGGLAAERQPLLSTPLPGDGHPNVNTAIDAEGVAADEAGTHVLPDSRMKLGACALNFFLSGMAMAAVGVSIITHTCTSEAR